MQVSYIVFVKECLLTAVTPLAQIPHRASHTPDVSKKHPRTKESFLATTLSSEISAKLDYACKKSKIGFGAKLIDLNSGLGSSNRLSDMIDHLPASAALVSVTGTLHMRVSC